MQNTLSKPLTADDERIIGKLIVEGLNGEITEATREELGKLSKNLPEPYRHITSYIGGYDADGKRLAEMLVDELRIIGMEKIEAKMTEPHPMGIDWITTYGILEVMLEGGDRDLRDEANIHAEAGVDIANIDRVPEWAQPLIKHIMSSRTQGKELTLHLLNILEAQIQKRRAELEKDAPE